MQDFDIDITLKPSATAYYGNDHNLGGFLLKGCLRRLSLLSLNISQATYLNKKITELNEKVNKCDYIGLADVIHFELIQNFPDFDSLLAKDTQNSAES